VLSWALRRKGVGSIGREWKALQIEVEGRFQARMKIEVEQEELYQKSFQLWSDPFSKSGVYCGYGVC